MESETVLQFSSPSREILQAVMTCLGTINARPIKPETLGDGYAGSAVDCGELQIVAVECDDAENLLSLIVQPTRFLPRHHREMYARHAWEWLEQLTPPGPPSEDYET